MSEYQKKYSEIFKGSGIVIAGTVIGYSLNYLFRMLSGRYLGPQGLGILAIGVSVMAVFANLSMIGFDEGIARFIPYYKQKKDYPGLRGILPFAVSTVLTVGVIISILVFYGSDWISESLLKKNNTAEIIKFFAMIIPFQVIYIFLLGVFRGLKKMGPITIANNIILWSAKICFFLLLVLLKLPVEYTAFVFFISVLLSIGYLLLKIKNDELLKHITQSSVRQKARTEFLEFSLPLTLSNIFTVLRKRTDILIVGIFLSTSDVGYYYAALPFAMLLTLFLFSINRILMPVASEAAGSGDVSKAGRLYKDFTLLCFQLTLPVFLLIYFFSGEIIHIVYGAGYGPAGSLLKILSIGFFINAITGSFGEYFKVFGKTRLNFYLSLLGGFLNVGFMILLVPAYGVKGAAISTSLVLLMMVLLGLVLCQRVLKINPFGKNYYMMMALTAAIFLFFLEFTMAMPSLHRLGIFVCFLSIYLGFFFKTNIGQIKSLLQTKKTAPSTGRTKN